MSKMRAIDAAVRVLEKEGVVCAFAVPGAAINPLYSALKKRGSINHILARHVEGASHMAEGYTRARAGNIGVCIGTSGPAGTDMITGLYSAISDSIPILASPGRRPVRVFTRRITTARQWMKQYGVPVVVEFILERVTNIAMGPRSITSSNSNRPSICRSMSRRCFRKENFCRREALDSESFQRNRSWNFASPPTTGTVQVFHRSGTAQLRNIPPVRLLTKTINSWRT